MTITIKEAKELALDLNQRQVTRDLARALLRADEHKQKLLSFATTIYRERDLETIPRQGRPEPLAHEQYETIVLQEAGVI